MRALVGHGEVISIRNTKSIILQRLNLTNSSGDFDTTKYHTRPHIHDSWLLRQGAWQNGYSWCFTKTGICHSRADRNGPRLLDASDVITPIGRRAVRLHQTRIVERIQIFYL